MYGGKKAQQTEQKASVYLCSFVGDFVEHVYIKMLAHPSPASLLYPSYQNWVRSSPKVLGSSFLSPVCWETTYAHIRGKTIEDEHLAWIYVSLTYLSDTHLH